jgi:hypothetical protein
VDCARTYINRLLGDAEYWKLMKKGFMKVQIIQSFPKALSEMEKDEEYDLRSSLLPLFFEVKLCPFRIFIFLTLPYNESLNF